MAASDSDSPRSTKPPGNTHLPSDGSIARFISTMPPSTIEMVQAHLGPGKDVEPHSVQHSRSGSLDLSSRSSSAPPHLGQ